MISIVINVVIIATLGLNYGLPGENLMALNLAVWGAGHWNVHIRYRHL